MHFSLSQGLRRTDSCGVGEKTLRAALFSSKNGLIPRKYSANRRFIPRKYVFLLSFSFTLSDFTKLGKGLGKVLAYNAGDSQQVRYRFRQTYAA